MFKGDAAEDPGFPDKRWLTIDELRAALASIEEKMSSMKLLQKLRAWSSWLGAQPRACLAGTVMPMCDAPHFWRKKLVKSIE